MGGGVGSGGGVGLGDQGGCDRRSEVFLKIKKKSFFGGGRARGGVRSGVGVGEGGSKVWGRWVMWGMEEVNQE